MMTAFGEWGPNLTPIHPKCNQNKPERQSLYFSCPAQIRSSASSCGSHTKVSCGSAQDCLCCRAGVLGMVCFVIGRVAMACASRLKLWIIRISMNTTCSDRPLKCDPAGSNQRISRFKLFHKACLSDSDSPVLGKTTVSWGRRSSQNLPVE